jgi:hypothetical protein
MTLTCDAAAKPVSLVPVREAVARVAASMLGDESGSVQVLAADERRRFRSQHLDLPAPLVVMWPDYVELEPFETERVSRRVLFARDGYACQYCSFVAHPGRALRDLTMDHVKPAHMFAGGRQEATTWDNVVAACPSCNHRKGGRLPIEAQMMPRCVPSRPHYVQLRFAGRLNEIQRSYVSDYFGEKIGAGL